MKFEKLVNVSPLSVPVPRESNASVKVFKSYFECTVRRRKSNSLLIVPPTDEAKWPFNQRKVILYKVRAVTRIASAWLRLVFAPSQAAHQLLQPSIPTAVSRPSWSLMLAKLACQSWPAAAPQVSLGPPHLCAWRRSLLSVNRSFC